MRKPVAAPLTTIGLLACVAIVLVPASAAAPAAKQRVMMEVRGSGPAGGPFVLTTKGAGPLKPDTGRVTFTASKREFVRDGQSVTAYTLTSTSSGKLGTLVLRERYDDFAAGRGYRVGTGVRTVLTARGTGQYAGLKGAGRSAYVLTPTSGPFNRLEGLVTKS